jgi:signal transduction histidine kinase
MVQFHRLTSDSLADGLLKMNARVFFASVLGICLFLAVYYFAPNQLIASPRFGVSMAILFEVTGVCVFLRVRGPAVIASRLGITGWRTIFIVHSTAYALTWGLGCADMIEVLHMNTYSISVTTTALAACTVAVSTFSFDIVACALFLGSLLLPLLYASLFTVANGQGLAGACTLSIFFFMYLAYSLHRAEVEGLLNGELIRRQADELERSNSLFRSTIDSIDEVFLAVGLDGICYGNRSDRAVQVLGLEPIGRHVADVLRGSAEDTDFLQTWFSLLASPDFDFVQIVDLAPDRWLDQTNNCTYRVAWFPMKTGGELSAVIMTLTDITLKLRNEAQALAADERARMTLSISADPSTFATFLARARAVLGALTTWPGGDVAFVQKSLHDLKGFAGVFGFASFITEVSRAENQIKALDGTDLLTLVTRASAALEQWLMQWTEREDALLRRLRVFEPQELTLAVDQVDALRHEYAADASALRDFDRIVARLSAPRLSRLLARLDDSVQNVARRLRKSVRLDVDRSCAGIYLTDPAWVAVVENMIHLINNAIDHGLETVEERRAVGKGDVGVIKIAARMDEHVLAITVEDDGRGVDVAKLRRRLAERGANAAALSDHEVAQTIFAAGISTAEVANDVSGQGVGLFALAGWTS